MASVNPIQTEDRRPLFAKTLIAALLALILVISGTVAHLSKNLPDNSLDDLSFRIEDFNFAFGSGIPLNDHMRVDQFC